MQFVAEQVTPRRAAYMGVAALLAFCGVLIATGQVPLVLAFAAAAVPVLAYYALVRPLVFPFGLYVLLIPFDNLLVAGSVGSVAKILGIVSGILILLWATRTHHVRMPDRSFFVLVAFFMWACVSTLWAVDQSAALTILPTYGGLIVLYGALCITRITLQQYRVLLFLIVAGGIAAALYGANVFFHEPTLAVHANDGRLVVQVGANSIDPNHFANALLFPAAVILMFALKARSVSFKVLGYAGLAAVAGAIMLSGSREALIGLTVIMLYYAWRSGHRTEIGFAGAIAAAAGFALPTSLWVRFANVVNTGGSGRTAIWSVGWEALKHNWLAGYGIGTFPAVYDMYYISVYQHYPNGWTSPAHNIVIHYFVELGTIGGLLLIAFFWLRFSSLSCIKKNSPLYDYRLMTEAILVAMIVVSLSIDLFTYKYFWIVFAMAALLRNVATADSDSRDTVGKLPHDGGATVMRNDEFAPAQAHFT